jgi:hypothetical protein
MFVAVFSQSIVFLVDEFNSVVIVPQSTALNVSPALKLTEETMTQTKLRAGLAIGLSFGLLASTAFASDLGFTPVPSANPKDVGIASPNVLPPELDETPVAQGSFKVENPSILTNYYGYDNNGPMVPAPGDLPTASHQVEATKTEPDTRIPIWC